MDSRSVRETDGLSASSSILPQLRASRRTSVTSLSNNAQLDKESLSQALDQIHSTASQSETLTTFNEYTSPPSSSSGPDPRGLAGELQGGLSGLYTRLRASVGNVKDIVNSGGEDAGRDTTLSLKSPKGTVQSPAHSDQSIPESYVGARSSTASLHISRVSAPTSGQASPVSTKFSDNFSTDKNGSTRSSKILGGSTGAATRSAIGSFASVKSPPASLTQAPLPTTVNPTVAEVNISAVRPQGSLDSQELDADGSLNTFSHDAGRHALTPRPRHGSGQNATTDSPDNIPLEMHTSEKNVRSDPVSSVGETGKASNSAGFVKEASSGEAERSYSQISQDTVQPFPNIDGGDNNDNAIVSSSEENDDSNANPRIVATTADPQDDVFHSSNRQIGADLANEPAKRTTYQHLELPLRRGSGPSLITGPHTSRPQISPVSSSEASADRFVDTPLDKQPPNYGEKPAQPSHAKGSANRFTPLVSVYERDPTTMNVFSQVKNKVLNKQYWMKDENARDCFYCGDPFSTFRRKHHCSKSFRRIPDILNCFCLPSDLTFTLGTCGQIFDAKCMSLVAGARFGQSTSLRVCKPCETIINGEDDSSEFSDDGTLSVRGLRPRHGSTGASDILSTPVSSSSPSKPKSIHRSSRHPDYSVPTMSIPATRKAGGDMSRKPTVLEIEAERTLARPTSSRSLKSSIAGKSYHPLHRRHNSRHLLQRGFRSIHEDSAPFHQSPGDEKRRSRHLPAFHDDNIIDPDLAPYLSDEESSGDEQISIMAALQGDELSRSHDNDRHGLSGLVAASRKARSKAGDKSVSGAAFTSRDGDSQSVSSFRSGNFSRSTKRRNLSVMGNMQLRPPPRSYRANPTAPISNLALHESMSSSALAQTMLSNSPVGESRMIRSSSMRGAAAPAIELNNASLHHVRKLLHQLLEESELPNVTGWEKALVPILLRVTDDVNPDVQNGDDIDIRHYVKLKKIPGGRPGDTSYVSGLVFTKNLALKGMPRSISHPNILILTFPLEYSRHQLHFMSLEPVIRQEREFLQNLVNRIAALRPQLLLVERNVSGLALDFLQQAEIATAYNVKASVLEAVSRCCQTKIISSIDKLAIKPAQAGKCASFYLKTYVNEGRKKTYMFLDGCAKELGCTIVLRGDSDATLESVKRITEFMIYVVYNLKLETCLMRDEFAAIPSTTELGSLSSGQGSQPRPFRGLFLNQPQGERGQTGTDRKNTESELFSTSKDASNADVSKPQGTGAAEVEKSKPSLPDEDSVPDDIPMPTFYGDMVEEHKTKILSASPFVQFVQPYLLMRAREQERRLAYLKRLRDQDIIEERILDEKSKPQKFDLIKPEMVHERVHTASKKVREVLHAVHDAEYDKALHNYQTQSKQWETHISISIDLFDPYAHQNIAILYSLVCTATTIPCSGPDILAFEFYNENETDTDFEADCTLGQYVEDLILGAQNVCIANGCERKMLDHHRQYVHGEAQLNVFVEQHPCKLRGLQDIILMWSTCRKCDKETQVMPMSESTWKYSFAKYLELSFWSSELHARADVCPHDLHRDHLRYFGLKDMALRVQHDPITLVEIIVPRARITWKVDNDLRFKNDLFTKIESRLNKFMISVKARIKSINTDSVPPEKIEDCKEEVERMSKRAAEEHVALIQKLRDGYMNSKHYEVIPLNRAIRAVQERAADWDNAFTDFDHNFFPSEKDIRRLAALQLKKIFLDRDASNVSLNSTDNETFTTAPDSVPAEKSSAENIVALTPQTRRMSPEKAHDMLAAVVEKHVSTDNNFDQNTKSSIVDQPKTESEASLNCSQQIEREEVRHLDLALPSNMPEKPGANPNLAVKCYDQNPEDRNQHEIPNASSKITSVQKSDTGATRSNLDPPKEAVNLQASGIPRPVETNQRRLGVNVSPALARAQSQPTHLRHDNSTSSGSQTSLIVEGQSIKTDDTSVATSANVSKPVEKKLSDRIGLSALKPTGIKAHSMIPRGITSRRNDSKVSNLAKHFEQLSKEFEKERIRERRQRAAKSRQARAYPMAASKPIVQIYRNVHEAVEEKDPSDEYLLSSDPGAENQDSKDTIDHMAKTTPSQTPGDDGFHVEETTAENTETDDNPFDSNIGSDVEGEGDRSDEDHSLESIHIPGELDDYDFSIDESQLDIKLDLPKHEKSSLMKMLTNFWAERTASGWQPLEYPLNTTDHVFADSDIIVREDEPSSLIAFALGSEDYQAKLRSIIKLEESFSGPDEKADLEDQNLDHEQTKTEQSILRPTGKHLKYQFAEGSAKMLCKVFYAEQFDALRRKCGVSERIVESLSRCMKWDSKGGKTKSVFLKTLDDRFVLKSLSPIETQAFLQFAPGYFYVMSRFLFHDMPSVIAKMLGFYQITIKNPVTGIDFNWTLLVMENLFYDRSPTRTFDLKGSMRNRRIQSTGEQNEVLLDENMVDFIYATPLFSREHSKRVLRASVYNDTLFLAKQNVMDYSLMVAIDEDRKELVVGIIDCIRTYTWDKKLETWIKDRGKNRPTVTSPKEYKSRFREAMSRYILQAPK